MAKEQLSAEQKSNHNRIITLIILAIFISTFVSINANKFLLSSGLYIGLSILSIILYTVWNRF